MTYMVDPDIAFCERISSLLSSSSLATKTFGRAKDFLEQSDSMEPDSLLILSSNIPDMDTVEVMQELKKRGNDIPVIVVGEDDDVPQAVKFMRAGAVDFIWKPLANQKLKALIEKLGVSINK